jgi:hypothetical protein
MSVTLVNVDCVITSDYRPVWKMQWILAVWRTNGTRVLSLPEEQTVSGCCPCLKNKRFQGAVPVCKTGLITVPVWATAVQLLAVPLGTMGMYVCVVSVRKRVAGSYLITILVCTTQYAACANGEITFGINGTRSADCTNVSGFSWLRNANVAWIAVIVPAWITGGCRDGDTEFNSGSSEMAYWRPIFCVFCTFFKCWNSLLNQRQPHFRLSNATFCTVLCHSTLYN